MSKPRVLLLGGMGFIGRNLVKYLVENVRNGVACKTIFQDLTSKIRVADKVPASMAYLGPLFSEAMTSPVVEFVQCNLSNDAGTTKAFDDEVGLIGVSSLFSGSV